MSEDRSYLLPSLIHYVGQRPLRAGRATLAVICWQSDFEAYRRQGHAITGHAYIKAERPGEMPRPKGILDALLSGWRWGSIEHRLFDGRLTQADALWIAAKWRKGVPV